MRARAWDLLLSSWAEMDARIARDLPSAPAAAPAAPPARRPAAGADEGVEARLPALRADLLAMLDDLGDGLRKILVEDMRQELGRGDGSVEATAPGAEASDARVLAARAAEDDIEQVRVPLAIHLDERVLGRLPLPLGPRWRRLQEDVIRSDDGGVVFYRRLDALLAAPRPSQMALEVYRFCLGEGYFGQHADAPETIQAYKDRIAERLHVPAPPIPREQPAPPEAAEPARRVLPPAAYYVAAIVVSLLLVALVWAAVSL